MWLVLNGTVRTAMKNIEMGQYYGTSFNGQALGPVGPAQLSDMLTVSLRAFRTHRICCSSSRGRITDDATTNQWVRGMQFGVIREVSVKQWHDILRCACSQQIMRGEEALGLPLWAQALQMHCKYKA